VNGTAFIAVGAGAALGAWLRWGLSAALNHVTPNLPLGTLAANVVGGYPHRHRGRGTREPRAAHA
jgi:CrcB protein